METKRVTLTIPITTKKQLDVISSKQRRNLVNTLEYALDLYIALHNTDGTTKYSVDNLINNRGLEVAALVQLEDMVQPQQESLANQVKEEYEPIF